MADWVFLAVLVFLIIIVGILLGCLYLYDTGYKKGEHNQMLLETQSRMSQLGFKKELERDDQMHDIRRRLDKLEREVKKPSKKDIEDIVRHSLMEDGEDTED